MRYLRKVRKVVTILSLVVYFLAYGIPHADPTQVAQAAGNFTISGMVYNNGKPIWDGFGVKITGSRGTTLWATTSGGYYQFNGFSSGTYRLAHNENCPSNTPADITISGNYKFNIHLQCPNPKPKVTVWGRVLIDGKAAQDGFAVRYKNKETGQEYWPKVAGGDGWYSHTEVEEGWYTLTHWQECPGDNNIDVWIGVGAEQAPQINLTCTQPKLKVTVWGRVLINDKPAHDGFGVRLKNKETGQEFWPKVFNGDGWYMKEQVEEGWYTFTHYHNCPGDNNIDAWIGAGAELAPQINLTCPKPTVTVYGQVLMDGKPAHDGFTVRFTNKESGQEYWPAILGGTGWYSKEKVEEGWYTLTHWQECAGDNNFDAFVGVGAEQAPTINLTCAKLKVTLWGRVMINGKPAHNGFTVRLKNTETGQEFWPKVFNGDGWYSKEQVPEGTYTFTHWQECPGDNNFNAFVGVGLEEAPQINLNCDSLKVTLWGRVMMDGKPAHNGFTVRLTNKATGQEFWPAVFNGDGWYSKEQVPEGTYTFTHWQECAGDNNFDAFVGVGHEEAPQINLTCETPKPKHTLTGKVTIDGVPAYKGFGVLLEGYGWYIINNDEGRYTFTDIPEGRYTVRHNFNICPTNEGNPQLFQVDGRTGPSFSIVCPKVEPVPQPPDPQQEPTCAEILTGLGIGTVVASSFVQQSNTLYLPTVVGNSSLAPTDPTPVVGYEMDLETFIRLGTKMDDIERYITVVTTNDLDVLVFDHEGARAAGFEPLLIDLANQIVQFQNEMMSVEGVGNGQLNGGYPLLNAYWDAAARYAESASAASVMNDTRGLSIEECVCGGFHNPVPNDAPRKEMFFNSEEEIQHWLSVNGYAPTNIIASLNSGNVPLDVVKILGWTKRITWQPDICGVDTFRYNSYYPNTFKQGSQVGIKVQDYSGYIPGGEPNPEVFLHGLNNWPYVSWPAYNFWWHQIRCDPNDGVDCSLWEKLKP